MRKLKVALIGYGYWGKKLLTCLQQSRSFDTAYVCDSKTDLSAIWPNVEAAVIATPIDTHYHIAMLALAEGKHVMVEKPLALTVQQCLEIRELSEKKHLTLFTDYTWTFSKSFRKAREIDIGELRALELEIRQLGRFLPWDVYWLLASHLLSILDMFVPLSGLTFRRRDLIKDELAQTGSIDFWGGNVSGQLSISLNFPGKDMKVVVYGSKGTVVVEPFVRPSVRTGWYKSTSGETSQELLLESKNYTFDETKNLRYGLQEFYKAVTGRTHSNIERAIAVTEILSRLNSDKDMATIR